MVEKTYYEEHLRRIKHVMKIIATFANHLNRIGIVGYSTFDQMFRENFPSQRFYNLVPSKLINASTDRKYTFECDLEQNSDKFSLPDVLFDGIIFTEVLEHMFFNDYEIMRNASLLLKRGGTLFFSVPNVSALAKLTFLSIGRNPYMTKERQINGVFGGYGHIREYSLNEAVNLVQSSSFKVIKVIGMNDYSNIFNKVARIFPKIYAETIMVIGKKLQ